MSTHPFMRIWVGDFIKDTLELDAKEIGAYFLLLMAMWERGGSLPADHAKLRRVARVGRDWPKVWAVLEPYFRQEAGRITNNRLASELHYARTKSTVAAQAGSLGGRAKSLKSRSRGVADAKRSLSYSESESNTPLTPQGDFSNLEFLRGPDPIAQSQVESIRKCIEWATRHISADRARSLVAEGLITEDECRKAGVL